MRAVRQELIPPTGVSHAIALSLIPARQQRAETKTVCQLVVARSSLLRIFDVREEVVGGGSGSGGAKGRGSAAGEGRSDVKLEPVDSGLGTGDTPTQSPTRTRLHLVREHRLHGAVTGLERVRTVASGEDGLDRLLVSFRDAKIALLEWTDAISDLSTVSLHTYERAPQVASEDTHAHRPLLRVDPDSRCAALLLPQDALAILPFVQRTGLDADVQARDGVPRDMPYTPSYVLSLPTSVDPAMQHILDLCFLPSFHTPTLAVLYAPHPTWTGALSQTPTPQARDACALAILTVDPLTRSYPLIARTHGLPYDAHSLTPAPAGSAAGGVVVLCANSVLHVDSAGKITGLAASAWHARVSALKLPLWPFGEEDGEGEEDERRLEGARLTWAGDRQMLLWGARGWVREIELVLDGRTVSALRPGRRLGRTVPPAVCVRVGPVHGDQAADGERDREGGYVLVGCEVGQSVLLRVARGELGEGKAEGMEEGKRALGGAEVKHEVEGEDMEIEEEEHKVVDEDVDLYGEFALPQANGGGESTVLPYLTLEVCDTISGHGPVADMVFASNQRNDRPGPQLITSTPCGDTGVFSIFENGLPLRVKRKLPVIAGSQGIWSIRVRREAKAIGSGGGSSRRSKRPEEEGEEGNDTLIISTDATPSPGISRTVTANSHGDPQIISRLPTQTIAAAAIFAHTCVMQVTSTTLRLLDPDGKELQVVKDTEGNKDGAPIVRAAIADPYVLVHRLDGSVALYLGDLARKKMRYKGLPSQREKTPTYAAAFMYTDHKGLLPAPSSVSEAASPANPRKRRASSLEETDGGLKDAEEPLSVEPETKRRRLRSADESKDRTDAPEKEKKSTNGTSGRSTRHTEKEKRDRERSREQSKDRERSTDKERSSRREDKPGETRKEGSRRHRDSEDGRRHKEKDAKDGKEKEKEKEGKENGSSSRDTRHRHREGSEKDRDSREKDKPSRSRHESERKKAPVEVDAPATQWLLLYNAKGRLEVWSLPKMTLAFSTRSVSECPSVLEDLPASTEIPEATEEEQVSSALEVEDVVLCPIGDDYPKLYLLIYYAVGRLAIYEATPRTPSLQDSAGSLQCRFVKVATHFVDAESHAAIRKMLPEARRLQLPSRRSLIPFALDTKGGISGVLQRGEEPCWVMATRQAGLQIIPASNQLVYSFAPTSLFGDRNDFILYSEEGPILMDFDEEPDTGRSLACTRVTSTRPYTAVAVDPGTNMLVAASSLKAPFLLFDDEEQPLWLPESAAFFGPMAESSSLELIAPGSWDILHGYEFGANEFVNTVKSVTLETRSTESGFKDYIAVGTSVYRGEDLAVRGATYIFEIIETVSYPDDPTPPYKLKLLARDEAKAPVNAICGMNGYLVSSMGLKVFVRAFEQDERLVGVAFMDAGVCVTNLTCLKNLLLVGDALRSVTFVAFQEDPFKLVVLARDQRPTCIADSAFLFNEDDFGIIASDEEGNLRIFEYDAALSGATHGNPLICTTEFHGQSEHTHMLPVAGRKREDPEDMPIPESQLVFGTLEGSIGTISPVPEEVFKRLQLLSGQLMRSVQHFAGLNPRAFRTVRNDHLSRPLNKGLLDYNVLHVFEELDVKRQALITKQIGTDTLTILRDLKSLQDVW